MNTPTPYENLIAAKLDQIPVPDMADSIWANIEMQLDADLSLDNDDKPSDNPTTTKPGLGKGFYFSILSAIIIALVIIYKENKKQKNKTNTLPVIPKTETVIPVTDSSQTIKYPVEKNNNPITTNSSNIKDTTANFFNPGNRLIFDSLTRQSSPLSQPDSSQPLQKNKIIRSTLDSVTLPPINKPKGVKGINDDDYKLKEFKKDTTKNGG